MLFFDPRDLINLAMAKQFGLFNFFALFLVFFRFFFASA